MQPTELPKHSCLEFIKSHENLTVKKKSNNNPVRKLVKSIRERSLKMYSWQPAL